MYELRLNGNCKIKSKIFEGAFQALTLSYLKAQAM